MKITPFLTSANRKIEYTTVAADADAMSYVDHARIDGSEVTAGIVRREVDGPDGKLTFFSRCLPAGESYRDEQGRPIYRVDGICVANDPKGEFVFHPHYLDEAAKINDGHFQKFWTRTDFSDGAVRHTDEIAFRPDLPELSEGIVHLPPYRQPESPKLEPAASTNEKATAAEAPEPTAEADGRLKRAVSFLLKNEKDEWSKPKVGLALAVPVVAIGGYATLHKKSETSRSWQQKLDAAPAQSERGSPGS